MMVAYAAPLTPISKPKMRIGSRMIFTPALMKIETIDDARIAFGPDDVIECVACHGKGYSGQNYDEVFRCISAVFPVRRRISSALLSRIRKADDHQSNPSVRARNSALPSILFALS